MGFYVSMFSKQLTIHEWLFVKCLRTEQNWTEILFVKTCTRFKCLREYKSTRDSRFRSAEYWKQFLFWTIVYNNVRFFLEISADYCPCGKLCSNHGLLNIGTKRINYPVLDLEQGLFWCCFFLVFFISVRLLSVRRGHSFFFIPATTANDLRLRRISIPDLIHHIIFLS